MEKKVLSIFALTFVLMLTACGMNSETIATYMTKIETSYQNGEYEQAQTEVKKLKISYRSMTDEQKAKYDELKSSIEYAVTSLPAINEGLDNAQGIIDQKMYYEASQELDKITASYTLPPAEQKKFDEKKATVDKGIKSVKAAEAMQKAESALSNGDYNTASNEMDNIDISTLTEEQSQKYKSLQIQIIEAKAKAEAEAKAKAEAAAKAVITNPDGTTGATNINGEYYYNGKPIGKGTLKQYMHGEISEAELQRQQSEYNSKN